MAIGKNKYFYLTLYLVVFPALGSVVGYVFFLIARLIGNPVGRTEMEIFISVWALFFLCAGIVGARYILKIDRLKKQIESRG